MNALEKILEEIEEHGNIQFSSYTKPLIAVEDVLKSIRSHMDEVPNCGKCSRRKWYQKGIEDGKKDSDWIPVEERLPNQNGVYNVTRLVDDAFISDSAYFDGQDTWHNDNRVNHTRRYLTDIVAWQPCPEPYKKHRQ